MKNYLEILIMAEALSMGNMVVRLYGSNVSSRLLILWLTAYTVAAPCRIIRQLLHRRGVVSSGIRK